METVAVNFHDETGDSVGSVTLNAGDDAANVRWCDVDRDMNLYASHKIILERVVKLLDAHW